jgi:hypothetical protein
LAQNSCFLLVAILDFTDPNLGTPMLRQVKAREMQKRVKNRARKRLITTRREHQFAFRRAPNLGGQNPAL